MPTHSTPLSTLSPQARASLWEAVETVGLLAARTALQVSRETLARLLAGWPDDPGTVEVCELALSSATVRTDA